MGCPRSLRAVEGAFLELMRDPQSFRAWWAPSQLAHCCCQCPLLHRRNLVEEVNASYMKKCLYHKVSHPLCPVFNLGYVAKESGQSFSTLAEKVLYWESGEGWALGS